MNWLLYIVAKGVLLLTIGIYYYFRTHYNITKRQAIKYGVFFFLVWYLTILFLYALFPFPISLENMDFKTLAD